MLGQSKTKAQDMFEDFVEELHARYAKDRPQLKEAYKAADSLDITTCGLEAFGEAIRAHEPCKEAKAEHIQVFYAELVKLAEEELEKKERKRLRAAKDFRRLVKKYIDRGKIQPTGTLEEAEAVCGERSAWKVLPLCICICICIHTRTHTHTHTCIYVHIYTYIHMYTHTYNI
jgi:hypothetical protein